VQNFVVLLLSKYDRRRGHEYVDAIARVGLCRPRTTHTQTANPMMFSGARQFYSIHEGRTFSHSLAKPRKIAAGRTKQSGPDSARKGLRHRQAANATFAAGERSPVSEEQNIERF
jgi:hypothetical protein